MQPSGLRAFEQRSAERSAIYSYEKAPAVVATHWVVSAKKEETRARRLAKLIEASAEKRRLDQFTATSRRSSR